MAKKRHWGRWVCTRCPRPWHNPPYLPFKFNTHIRHHLQRYHQGEHTVRWWCFDDDEYEDTWGFVQLPLTEIDVA